MDSLNTMQALLFDVAQRLRSYSDLNRFMVRYNDENNVPIRNSIIHDGGQLELVIQSRSCTISATDSEIPLYQCTIAPLHDQVIAAHWALSQRRVAINSTSTDPNNYQWNLSRCPLWGPKVSVGAHSVWCLSRDGFAWIIYRNDASQPWMSTNAGALSSVPIDAASICPFEEVFRVVYCSKSNPRNYTVNISDVGLTGQNWSVLHHNATFERPGNILACQWLQDPLNGQCRALIIISQDQLTVTVDCYMNSVEPSSWPRLAQLQLPWQYVDKILISVDTLRPGAWITESGSGSRVWCTWLPHWILLELPPIPHGNILEQRLSPNSVWLEYRTAKGFIYLDCCELLFQDSPHPMEARLWRSMILDSTQSSTCSWDLWTAHVLLRYFPTSQASLSDVSKDATDRSLLRSLWQVPPGAPPAARMSTGRVLRMHLIAAKVLHHDELYGCVYTLLKARMICDVWLSLFNGDVGASDSMRSLLEVRLLGEESDQDLLDSASNIASVLSKVQLLSIAPLAVWMTKWCILLAQQLYRYQSRLTCKWDTLLNKCPLATLPLPALARLLLPREGRQCLLGSLLIAATVRQLYPQQEQAFSSLFIYRLQFHKVLGWMRRVPQSVVIGTQQQQQIGDLTLPDVLLPTSSFHWKTPYEAIVLANWFAWPPSLQPEAVSGQPPQQQRYTGMEMTAGAVILGASGVTAGELHLTTTRCNNDLLDVIRETPLSALVKKCTHCGGHCNIITNESVKWPHAWDRVCLCGGKWRTVIHPLSSISVQPTLLWFRKQ